MRTLVGGRNGWDDEEEEGRMERMERKKGRENGIGFVVGGARPERQRTKK